MFDEGLDGIEQIITELDPLRPWASWNVTLEDDCFSVGPDGTMYREFLASLLAPSLSDIVEFYISFEYKNISGPSYMKLSLYSDVENMREYTFPLGQQLNEQWHRITQRIPLGALSSEVVLNKVRYTLYSLGGCSFKNLSFKVVMVPGGISKEEKDQLDNFRDKTITYGLDANKPRLVVRDDVFKS